MKMEWISHNLDGKKMFLTEKRFDDQLSVAFINSIFLIFIITMKMLSKLKMK